MPDATDVLIVGCGYLGMRAARRWLAAGRTVAALTRGREQPLAELGIQPIRGDVMQPESLSNLPTAGTLLYAVGLDRDSGHSMREVYVRGLGHVLDALAGPGPWRILYVSSTSVYGQGAGVWVDEASPPCPREESGRIVLEAENLLRSRRPEAIILRFAGIYGPGRTLRRRLMFERQEPITADPEGYLNLIHVDDGVEAVLTAEAHAQPGEVYLVVDDEPVRRRDYYTTLAERLGTPPPIFSPSPSEAANRRISNRKLKALGWQPRFPSYREGIPHALIPE